MPVSQVTPTESGVKRMSSIEPWAWFVLAAVIVLGFVLRGARLGEAPGGYLVFNEGWYIDLATRMAQQPAFAWFLHPLDVNNPPLYAVLVSWVYRLGAPHVAGARLVSVLAGTWSVLATFMLGWLLFEEQTGIIAAALLAVMPGAVLVDHNIQVDPLFVGLMLTSVCLYVYAVRSRSATSAFLGGVVLGLAFLAKQPAVLVLPALALWETWCAHTLTWLKGRRVWRFAVGFALVGVPWYLAQVAMNNMGSMFSNAAHIAAAIPLGGSWFWSFGLLSELGWMLFPVAGLLGIAGLVYAGRERRAGDKLLLVFAAVYLAWYVAFRQHSYYLLPLAPVFALAIGRLCSGFLAARIDRGWVWVALVGTLVVVMAFASVLMLGGQKWGRWSPMAYRRAPDEGYSSVHLFYDASLPGIFGPSMSLMQPLLSATPIAFNAQRAPDAPGVEGVFLGVRYVDAQNNPIPASESVAETWIRPVLFGYAIGQTTLEDSQSRRLRTSQFFTNSKWTAERVGSWWRFGIQSTLVDSGLYIYAQ